MSTVISFAAERKGIYVNLWVLGKTSSGRAWIRSSHLRKGSFRQKSKAKIQRQNMRLKSDRQWSQCPLGFWEPCVMLKSTFYFKSLHRERNKNRWFSSLKFLLLYFIISGFIISFYLITLKWILQWLIFEYRCLKGCSLCCFLLHIFFLHSVSQIGSNQKCLLFLPSLIYNWILTVITLMGVNK